MLNHTKTGLVKLNELRQLKLRKRDILALGGMGFAALLIFVLIVSLHFYFDERRGREGGREGGRERECVCVCVFVCVHT